MRHWMPDVQLIWSEGVAHMLDESRRLGSILKPLCEYLDNSGHAVSVLAQLGRTRSCTWFIFLMSL